MIFTAIFILGDEGVHSWGDVFALQFRIINDPIGLLIPNLDKPEPKRGLSLP
jgi:hypothetical protein